MSSVFSVCFLHVLWVFSVFSLGLFWALSGDHLGVIWNHPREHLGDSLKHLECPGRLRGTWRCPGSHPRCPEGSHQTVHFHRQNDALGAISNPKSPRSRPELPNCPCSSPKRCPRSHFQPEVAQKPTRAIPSTIFLELFRSQPSHPRFFSSN